MTPYDRNSWQDTAESIELSRRLSEINVLVEGYPESPTFRRSLGDMYTNGDPKEAVPIDGVGGTVLLVRADLTRDGLIFPPVPYLNALETEGLGLMARSMGAQPYGLPNYVVFHA